MKNEYDFSRAQRGPAIPPEPGKSRITIRLDNATLDWFRREAHRSVGGSYQNLINEALAKHVASTQEPSERTLRRVIREELRKTG